MGLSNETEVANTRAKLADLEASYDALLRDIAEDENVREVTLRSLKRYINQFKEEIARFGCCRDSREDTNGRIRAPRGINSDIQLENTRKKLSGLEELIESNRNELGDDVQRRTERVSLKRLANQLREEIARYEARQPTT